MLPCIDCGCCSWRSALATRGPVFKQQMASANGLAGHGQAMEAVFPEALKTLADADPEVAAIIEDEKRRQW